MGKPKKAKKAAKKAKKHTGITVELIGHDGNAFMILGRVTKALKRAGLKDEAAAYQKEAMSGDYDHLLAVTAEYVDIA